ncbi:dihydrofolate reductase family protein [Streptomyces sp. NPDC057680]|uniref:dihydrofolate reductase family protein n=1 Tax=Streptomyces sp. NPDC057680 TaxID=3346208 RepID=UPI0036819617
MGLITIEMFATLDLVGQAPGGPEEDPAGFPFGGWQAPLLDEVGGAQIGAAYEGTDALLLGRRTYDIFAGYWPHQSGGEDGGIATLFNSIPKYVASRGTPDLPWEGSTQLGPNLADAVREIRDRHEDVKVVGSLNLVQTLLREKLFDRIDLWLRWCSASGRRCSRTARCPPTSRSSRRPRPARRALCSCATGSPTARPRRGT